MLIAWCRRCRWSVLLAAVLLLSGCRGWWFWTPGDTVENVGYKPMQPIAFNHKLHAGEKQISCEYCHSQARWSASAGIPPVNTCMGCHNIVGLDKDEVKKIHAHWDKKEPIEWTKVHDLPDYVRFTHKRHVAAGLACQDCHGKVEEMGVAEQVAPLQMGWCVSCHAGKLEAHGDGVQPVKKGAPMECFTCHY